MPSHAVAARPTAAAAWTPNSISTLAAWLDANVSGSMTDAGSGLCSAWADQKGADDGATSGVGVRPTITTDATSGKGALDFTNKSMTIADSGRLYASGGITACIAGNFTAWANFANLLIQDSTGWNALGWRIVNNSGTVQASVGTSDGTKTCNFGAVAGMTGRQILTLRCGTTSNKLEIWKNGTSVTNTASTGTITDTASAVLMMGDGAGAGSVNGKVFEVIICAGDISDSDLASMHSYLASKWSIP